MKCPDCKTDGAYQPLLRQLECVSILCKFYVEPKDFHTTLEEPGAYSHPKDGDYTEAIQKNALTFPVADGTKPLSWPVKEADFFPNGYWGKGNVFRQEYEAQFEPVKVIEDVDADLDSMKVIEIRHETNHYGHHSDVTMVLQGHFYESSDMHKAIKRVKDLLDHKNQKSQECMGLILPTEACVGQTLLIKKGTKCVQMTYNGRKWLQI